MADFYVYHNICIDLLGTVGSQFSRYYITSNRHEIDAVSIALGVGQVVTCRYVV
jgi:hypothetical protein